MSGAGEELRQVLVFGRTGQVARELAKPRGRVQIAALGRAEADLTDPAACAAMIAETPAQAVINAAAYTAVDRAEAEADLAFRVNGEAPAAMARAAAARGLPFVHISTDYVFDGSGDRPWPVDAATGPLGVYGASKLAGEEGVRAAGGVHAILRTSWVISAHGQNFVKTMLRLGRERERLAIVADQIGAPTPAAAIAEACLNVAAALRRDPQLSGTYHFAGAPEVSWAGFARAIFEAAGLDCAVADITTAEYPTPARRPANSRLDTALTQARFGLAPPDWRDGLRDILQELGALST